MNRFAFGCIAVSFGVSLGLAAGIVFSQSTAPRPSAIVSRSHAKAEQFAWGTMYTYYEGESFSAKADLAAVAVIKPGQQIHPPHQHADEEYLMVVAGQGTWTLKDQTMPANAGDMLYAAPWDVHGITNTGKTPLTFVVWKWTGKGVEPLAAPSKAALK
jgi:mannose-6-phosphate isomerase-like protein (cupin superfamily)